MSLWIAGLGTALPPYAVDQDDATVQATAVCRPALSAQAAAGERLLARLFRNSGVATRHSVVLEASSSTVRSSTAASSDDGNGHPARQSFYQPAVDEADEGPTTAARMRVYEKEAPKLASEAARAALADAREAAEHVTHLITVSCSGFFAPGCDAALIRELGLSLGVARTHVGFMGCHGALNALRVAKAFTDADPGSCVLLCAVELCTLHYQYGASPEKLLANALFADGAAAVVARGGNIAGSAWSLADSGSIIVPGTSDLMTWAIRDHGFEMGLSQRVPDAIREHLRPWLESWLAEHGLTIPQVPSWAIHPGGPKILATCADVLQLRPEQIQASEEVLARCGNMSSATILFVLDRLRQCEAPRPCVALAFGPGLALEAALFC